jgi:hypothetical protein
MGEPKRDIKADTWTKEKTRSHFKFVKAEKRTKICLKCLKPFISDGPHNRICCNRKDPRLE